MYYHLDIENQVKKIMSKIKFSDLNHEESTADLTDIVHGLIYKRLLESEDGILFKQKKALSLIMNTDGKFSFLILIFYFRNI